MSSRTLSFREEAALRRIGVATVVCAEADGGRVFRLSADEMRRHGAGDDFAAFVAGLIDADVLVPGFVLPSQFLPEIIMRASPEIRQVLARAESED